MSAKSRISPTFDSWLDSVGAANALDMLASLSPESAVFAVDGDRNLVFWSDGARELLGFEADEVLGQHCLKCNRCVPCISGCGIEEYGAVVDHPLELVRADGSRVRVRKTAEAFFDDDGKFAGGIELLAPDHSTRAVPAVIAAATPEVVTFHGLASVDPAMHRVFQSCANVAETDASALVRGESGTGKELVARALHAASSRRPGPFIAVNCAALTPSLIESELFGHIRGAFTGAAADRKGIFEQADGGTLFLDEVAELPLPFQAKLLRVLEDHTITPVGGTRAQKIDVRIVAATHRSLRAEVAGGRFREDLMYRLRVVPIFLPPLRERQGDITLLLWRFIGMQNSLGRRHVTTVAPEAMRLLLDYRWPGNVRELRNVVEYAFAVGRGSELTVRELPPEFREGSRPSARSASTQSTDRLNERERIQAALVACDGNVGEAARQMGVSRPTFWRKRKKYGL